MVRLLFVPIALVFLAGLAPAAPPCASCPGVQFQGPQFTFAAPPASQGFVQLKPTTFPPAPQFAPQTTTAGFSGGFVADQRRCHFFGRFFHPFRGCR